MAWEAAPESEYLQSTLDRAQAEGLSLDDNEEWQLRAWLWPPGTVRAVLDEVPPAVPAEAALDASSSGGG